jgi:N-acyl homoserine lactone hydrolase
MNPELRLYVLDGGTIEIRDWSIYNPAAEAGSRMTLANAVYLIVHDKGTVLWDTGLGDGLAGREEPLVVDDHAVFDVRETLAGQLDAIGHPAGTITHLALSHFHPDHVGNAGLFGSATLLVQRDEYAAAFGDDPAGYHYDQSLYKALADSEVQLLDGDHDVFGDGLVEIKRLSGHTVGPVLLTGDLAHTCENWEQRAIPPVLNIDPAESARSLVRAEGILAAEQASLWVQHDLAQYQSLRHSPEFYR